ncbi:MAG TPA: N-acetylmuramoyl-L-alanine amidase CwlD [Pseudogracilibacillus sp.]|nr:N-acetylmuramoyl-L-alanine amidase CwlD [Pseudogracilibacillus sp.]
MQKIAWSFGVILLMVFLLYPYEEAEPVSSPLTFPLAGKRIVLDAGHGGVDGGAVYGGVSEKDITLDITKWLRMYLEQAGAAVYMTRDKDEDLARDDIKSVSRRKSEDIRARVAFIDHKEADLFLTIHLNALDDSKWSGAQTFYTTEQELAEAIQASLRKQLANTTRQALPIENIYLLQETQTPGVLVEAGFLSNEKEREQLIDETYQKKIAIAIYYGLLNKLGEEVNP